MSTGSSEKVIDLYLLRHGHSTANNAGILAGRDNTVHLTAKGFDQAAQVVKPLAELSLSEIYTSPITRCRETLQPLSKAIALKPITDKRLIEMDYGSWSGKKLSNLATKPLWREIQSRPSTVRFPDGESFLEMVARISDFFDFINAASKRSRALLICSHGDVIKAMVAHALGLHIDQFQRLVIDPASISHIRLSKSGMTLVKLNDTSHLAPGKKSNVDRAILGGGAG